VIEDVENNSVERSDENTIQEIARNLKRKAEEKINSLMRGIKYPRKVSRDFNFLSATIRNATRISLLRKHDNQTREKNHRKVVCEGRVKKSTKTKKKKKIQTVGRKTKKLSKCCRAKKRSISDIFS